MLIAALLSLAPSYGAMIPVGNHSFESGTLSDGATQNLTQGAPWDWSQSPAGTFSGFYNPTSGHYASAGGAGTPTGADGSQLGFAFKYGATAFQTLRGNDGILGNADDPVLTALTHYTLTLAVGHRLVGNPSGNFPFGTLEITLLAGSTVIGQDSVGSPAPGQFVDQFISVDSSTLDSALYGQALSIRLRQTAIPDSVADFDNVRLNATPVPEPSTALFGVVCLITVLSSRTRNRRNG